MFSRKKMVIEVSHDDPVFNAIYLGNQMVMEKTKQSESVLQTAWSLWKRNGRHCKKVSVTIGMRGINVNEKLDSFGQQHAVSYFYPIGDISYCMANKDIGGIFVWLESSGLRGDTRCHGVACETPHTAKAMARALTECCNVAHNEMLAKARRDERQKELEKRLVTERMRINTKSPVKNSATASDSDEDDDEDGFDFGFFRNRPLKGGVVDKTTEEKYKAKGTAKLKCIKIGSRKFTDNKLEDSSFGKLEVESNFYWNCKQEADPTSNNNSMTGTYF